MNTFPIKYLFYISGVFDNQLCFYYYYQSPFHASFVTSRHLTYSQQKCSSTYLHQRSPQYLIISVIETLVNRNAAACEPSCYGNCCIDARWELDDDLEAYIKRFTKHHSTQFKRRQCNSIINPLLLSHSSESFTLFSTYYNNECGKYVRCPRRPLSTL